MAHRRARLWFTVQIRSTCWRIVFGNLRGKGEELTQGLCDYDKAQITISWNLAREQIYTTLWHELSHAVADASGADRFLVDSLRHTGSMTPEQVEEIFIRTHSHGLFDVAASSGWLRLPEIPIWFDK